MSGVKLFLSNAPKVYLFYVDSTPALSLPCFGWREPMSGVLQVAVAAKNYKEAGQVSRQIKDTERRQQEVGAKI